MSSALSWSFGFASILEKISVIMIISSLGVLSRDRYPEKSATLTCRPGVDVQDTVYELSATLGKIASIYNGTLIWQTADTT